MEKHKPLSNVQQEMLKVFATDIPEDVEYYPILRLDFGLASEKHISFRCYLHILLHVAVNHQ